MPDQTVASRSSKKQLNNGRRHDGPERSASRAVGAAIVADGLAFSVSLYPLPGEPPTLELTPPKRELSVSPKTVDLEPHSHSNSSPSLRRSSMRDFEDWRFA